MKNFILLRLVFEKTYCTFALITQYKVQLWQLSSYSRPMTILVVGF